MIETAPQIKNDQIFWSNFDNVVSVQDPLNTRRHGTGLIILTSKGKQVVLTNNHVCEGLGRDLFLQNSAISSQAQVLYTDKKSDLCLVSSFKKLEVRNIPLSLTMPRPNENIFSIGYPLEHDKNLLSGRVISEVTIPVRSVFMDQERCDSISAQDEVAYCFVNERLVATNVVNFPGGSGSPVFNLENELVGLMSSTAPMSNFGHMVRLDDIKRVLDLY